MREHSPVPHGGSSTGRLGTRLLPLTLLCFMALAPVRGAEARPPRTLWDLTAEAQLVVWADVEEVEESAPPPSGVRSPTDAIARLHVRETWKGSEHDGERIEVHFQPELNGPDDASYEPGFSVLVFLVRERGQWRTPALADGTRTLPDALATAAYRQVVRLARMTQEEWIHSRIAGRTYDLGVTRLNWQVFAATLPATRRDGLAGLPSDGAPAHARPRAFLQVEPYLTTEHRALLAASTAKHPLVDDELPMMLTALRGFASRDVDRAATNALEALLQKEPEDPPYWARLAFDLLRERYGERPVQRTRLLASPHDPRGTPTPLDEPPEDSLAQQWQRFKQRHNLQPAAQ
ncbi:hypothetical protein LZ198_32370 [Myxococcus sp. K15C18031901]|uniref:hypothetical protein n=1 Tax=Myxococcus dinghuensis TaxID=2906761 RepID=UPI0020A8031B|nr:hypothetical protein [Myxococcus dinghuensis]MCP3103589.1 hypothetical protein [Myxococcus dinghuensis]